MHLLDPIESSAATTRELELPSEGGGLAGRLTIPAGAGGLVILAGASGTRRFAARSQFLASELQRHNLATLLLELLTSPEGKDDLERLSRRLIAAAHWVAHQPETERMRVGCLDGPIGPGVALEAAARRPNLVQAVVSVGARPHVARTYFGSSKAPTLWLVGENDGAVLHLDPKQIAHIFGQADLEIVPGAGSLFDEPGALARVGQLASRWFERWLVEDAAGGLRRPLEGAQLAGQAQAADR